MRKKLRRSAETWSRRHMPCMLHTVCRMLYCRLLHAGCCMLHLWYRPTVLDGAAPSLNAAQRSAKVITMVEEFCAHFPLRRAKFKDTAVCCPDPTPSGIPIGYHAEWDTMPCVYHAVLRYHALWETMLHAENWHVGWYGQRFCEAKMEEHANEIGRVIVANAHADGGELAILEGVCTDILEARLFAPLLAAAVGCWWPHGAARHWPGTNSAGWSLARHVGSVECHGRHGLATAPMATRAADAPKRPFGSLGPFLETSTSIRPTRNMQAQAPPAVHKCGSWGTYAASLAPALADVPH